MDEKRQEEQEAWFSVQLFFDPNKFELQYDVDDLVEKLNYSVQYYLELGIVYGGMVFENEEGGLVYRCDLRLTDISDKAINALVAKINVLGFPKGSELVWDNGRREVGTL